MAWTPKLDECETGRRRHVLRAGVRLHVPRRRGQGRSSRRTSTSRAMSRCRRSTATVPTGRATRRRRDPVPGQGRAGHRAEPVQRLLRRHTDARGDGATHPRHRSTSSSRWSPARRQRLAHAHAARRGRAAGGERFGDLRGKYYRRVRAQIPADFVQPGTAQTPRPLVAGDVVNVRVIAGSQQQRFSYRVVSTRPAGDAKRVLVVAAEDYTGLSPNKTPYATGAALPRRARRGARGQRLHGRDVQHRQPARGSRRLARVQAAVGPRRAVALRRRRLLHGRRPGPAGSRPGRDRHQLPPRRHRGGERDVQPDRVAAPDHDGRPQRPDAAQLHERGRQGRLLGA